MWNSFREKERSNSCGRRGTTGAGGDVGWVSPHLDAPGANVDDVPAGVGRQ